MCQSRAGDIYVSARHRSCENYLNGVTVASVTWLQLDGRGQGQTSLRRAKSFKYEPVTVHVYSVSQNSFHCIKLVRSLACPTLDAVWYTPLKLSALTPVLVLQPSGCWPWCRSSLALEPCFYLLGLIPAASLSSSAFPLLQKDKAQACVGAEVSGWIGLPHRHKLSVLVKKKKKKA